MQTQIHQTQPGPIIALETRRGVAVSTCTANQIVISSSGD